MQAAERIIGVRPSQRAARVADQARHRVPPLEPFDAKRIRLRVVNGADACNRANPFRRWYTSVRIE